MKKKLWRVEIRLAWGLVPNKEIPFSMSGFGIMLRSIQGWVEKQKNYNLIDQLYVAQARVAEIDFLYYGYPCDTVIFSGLS